MRSLTIQVLACLCPGWSSKSATGLVTSLLSQTALKLQQSLQDLTQVSSELMPITPFKAPFTH